jgi:hypothetical protein
LQFVNVDLAGNVHPRPMQWKWDQLWSQSLGATRSVLTHAAQSQSVVSPHRRCPEDKEPVDVVISTLLSSWEAGKDTTPGHHEYWNRYMSGLYERLEAQGFRVAWMPLCQRAKEIEQFESIFYNRNERVCWASTSLPLTAQAQIAACLARILIRYQRSRKRLFGHRRFALDGLDLSRWIIRDVDSLLAKHAFRYLCIYESQRNALLEIRPSAVLYKNELFRSGIALAATGVEGVKFLALQHGTIPVHHWQYRHSPRLVQTSGDMLARDYARYFPYPDKFMTYGSEVNELMSLTGYPSDRLDAIGSLRHDELFERAANISIQPDLKKRATMHLPTTGLVLLVCTRHPETVPTWIERIVDALRQLGREAHIAVKTHWRFPCTDEVESAFHDHGWHDWSLHSTGLFDLILTADIVIVGTSTTGLEAAILKTPLICMTPEVQGHRNSYVTGKIALPAGDTEEMKHALERTLEDSYQNEWLQSRTSYLRRHMVNIDQPAVHSLAKSIRK